LIDPSSASIRAIAASHSARALVVPSAIAAAMATAPGSEADAATRPSRAWSGAGAESAVS